MFNTRTTITIIALIGICGFVTVLQSKPTTYPNEQHYLHEPDQAKLINQKLKGELEHPTVDGSRVDILTQKYAYEVDWSSKWAEAVGQSLYYAAATGKKPAIILLMKDRKAEQKYYLRCLVVCSRHDIHLEAWDAFVENQQ